MVSTLAIEPQTDRLNNLAQTAANGGDRAFFQLVNACRSLIVYQVKRIGFRSAILGKEDLEQIARLAIYEALKNWSPRRSRFSTFASRVMRCRLLSAVRANTSTHTTISLPTNDPILDRRYAAGPSIYERMAMKAEAEAILKTMTTRDRTIVIAIANGKPYREIGQHFGLSAGQVDNIVQRLRRVNRKITGSQ